MAWDTEVPELADAVEYEELLYLITHAKYQEIKVDKYLRSKNEEVQSLLFEAYWKKWLKHDEDTLIDFALTHLENSFRAGLVSDRRHGRMQAADYLRCWFIDLWSKRLKNRSNLILVRIKNLLGELCKESIAGGKDPDHDIKEVVLLVILEHIYPCDGVIEFYSDWLQDSLLAGVHREAIELAQGWKELDELR